MTHQRSNDLTQQHCQSAVFLMAIFRISQLQCSTIDGLHDRLSPINNPTYTLLPGIRHCIFRGNPANWY